MSCPVLNPIRYRDPMSDFIAELPASVARIDGLDGGDALRVDGTRSSGVVQLHGAHVTSFVPVGGDEMLWMSPLAKAGASAIRGGVPVCFPWFGSGVSGDMKPSHGPARVVPWRLVEADDDAETVRLHFELSHADVAGAPGGDRWPEGLVAHYVVTFGEALTLELGAVNDGSVDVTVEAALHTYLRVADVRQVAVEGAEGASVLDQLTGRTHTQDGAVVFDGEVDSIVHLEDAPLRLVSRDDAARSLLTLTREGSGDVVVWNPHIEKVSAMGDVPDDAWPGFVCLETANVRDNAVTLAPGTSRTMRATYVPGE